MLSFGERRHRLLLLVLRCNSRPQWRRASDVIVKNTVFYRNLLSVTNKREEEGRESPGRDTESKRVGSVSEIGPTDEDWDISHCRITAPNGSSCPAAKVSG
ncbi:hypothetical protein JOB18_003133 [Solea senegalensis]|uniref:Uncharacterized protein n=1 Tax=Solea senegalensis TaxID=28829 RepID=A0AAV6QEU2_SOLSE|nr:hypothetical protein JOB18_003133 [Solea senegalensis]